MKNIILNNFREYKDTYISAGEIKPEFYIYTYYFGGDVNDLWLVVGVNHIGNMVDMKFEGNKSILLYSSNLYKTKVPI